MDDHLPVLIVGAGPTGLMMGCELARRKIPFRIIERKRERTLSSNATWIQTRTLEIFNQMGIVDRFIRLGHPCDAINLYIDGKLVTQLSLKYIDSIYQYILMLPQSETERILEEYLNELDNQVERGVELIDIKLSSNHTTSTIQHADGQKETITSNWLIACDGANSIVRDKCGLHFAGEDLSEQFVVADATINFSHLAKDEIHLFFDPGTVFAAFPLGSGKYRLAVNLHLDYPRKLFTEREVIEIVQERAHGNYYVTNVNWISLFWIHGKVSESMRHGNVFLAGDAAHIHSPAGGQGMNTGLQDAYNLAWKLALVIQEKSKPTLLESYQIERHPIVKEVVEQNEQFTKMALFSDNFLIKLQEFKQQLSENEKDLSKQIGEHLTQLDIRYLNSPIINYKSESDSSLLVGERAPDVSFNHFTLYQYLSNTQHNILLFTGKKLEKRTIKELTEIREWFRQHYFDLIRIHIITIEKLEMYGEVIWDVNGLIHKQYHTDKPTICIIRPDSYIASYVKNLSLDVIEKFLNLYLLDEMHIP